ncbi:hypothetical protein [Allokutzneria albata]|uniref:tRNA nuclease CdiA C-terminal domain-containing protein n=1 Tax=Allokutzneria albata TaxID=211114 RepID=A0A1G9V3F0_ALLAB|nr:hypothetical protein [Allokutzneria albata]SDM66613.1 hypothetical protein SAMN04489726_2803 [Allokutzneria albata]
MVSSIGELRARLQAAVDELPLDDLTAAREHLRGVVLPRLHHLARSSSNPRLHEALAALNRAGVELDSGRRHAHETHRVTRDYMHSLLSAPQDDRTYRFTEHAVHAPPTRPVAETSPVVSPRRQPAPWVTDNPRTWPGRVDEGQVGRRFAFNDDERSIARWLARLYPYRIAPIPRTDGRTADSAVNGYTVEFKTLRISPEAPRHGPENIGRTIKKMQRDRRGGLGQGNNIIIDASRVTLSKEQALQGLNDYLGSFPDRAERLVRVRILGADYEIDWNRTRG